MSGWAWNKELEEEAIELHLGAACCKSFENFQEEQEDERSWRAYCVIDPSLGLTSLMFWLPIWRQVKSCYRTRVGTFRILMLFYPHSLYSVCQIHVFQPWVVYFSKNEMQRKKTLLVLFPLQRSKAGLLLSLWRWFLWWITSKWFLAFNSRTQA